MSSILYLRNADGTYTEIPALVGTSVTGVAIDEHAHLIVTLSNGTVIDAGELPKGPAGLTPVKGVDYFTEAEKQEIIEAVKDGAEAVEWQDLDFNATNVSMPTDDSAVYAKTNGIVSVQGAVKLLKSLESAVSLNVGTLPEGFRPKRNVYTMRNIGGSWYRVGVNTTGAITLIHWQTNAITTTYNIYINIEFAAGN